MFRRKITAIGGFTVLAGTLILGGVSPALAGPVADESENDPKILYYDDVYGNKYNDFGLTAHIYHELMGYEEGEGDDFYWWLKDQEALWG